jgi:hypothetical protein
MKRREPNRFLKAAWEFYRSSPKEQKAVMIRAGVLPEHSERRSDLSAKSDPGDRDKNQAD